jgi:hypothetical protein
MHSSLRFYRHGFQYLFPTAQPSAWLKWSFSCGPHSSEKRQRLEMQMRFQIKTG